MIIDGLAERVLELRDAPADEQLLRAAEIGEFVEARLADGTTLAGVAAALVTTAAELGCDHIVGASLIGQRLAGAAVATASNGLRASGAAERIRHVLLVDAFVVTGAQLASSSHELEEHGAEKISAAVVARGFPEADVTPAMVERLVVLDDC